MEKTRRGVENLVVDAGGDKEQASMRVRVMGMAKEGWRKIKGLLEGKKMVRENGRIILENRTEGESAGATEEWEEGEEGGMVEVEMSEMEKDRSQGGGSTESATTARGFGFLGGLNWEEKDDELEKKLEGARKRKREEELTEVTVGMMGVAGWKWREREEVESKRWKRTVRRQEEWDGIGEVGKKVEKIPLPEEFRLGLDGRGKEMNHSGRMKNNFGLNKRVLFPGGGRGPV